MASRMRAYFVAGLTALFVGSMTTSYAKPVVEPSIVDVIAEINAETGEFSSLIAALGAADPSVLETLDSKGQRTVFAPTDEAFENLLEELGIPVEDLLGDLELLTDVLLYHVAPGRRYAKEVLKATRIRTLQKEFLFQDGGVLTDNQGREATIVETDIEADNGIIHVINAVVLP